MAGGPQMLAMVAELYAVEDQGKSLDPGRRVLRQGEVQTHPPFDQNLARH